MHALLLCLFCMFLTSSLLPAAATPRAPVTVLVDFEKPHSAATVSALRNQLKNLLDPIGIDLDFRLKSETSPGENFGELVVFKMKGLCSMKALPIGALSDERGALAMAFSSDGEVLHFGEVECDRVRETLQRVLGYGSPDKYQGVYGIALATVIAHEMYHMIGDAKGHTRDGLTKSSLSARELLEGDLNLPDHARQLLRRNLYPGLRSKP